MAIMPCWTTLILVTVLFGVICGNRFMDNRLLRSSYTGSPYKSVNDINLDPFNNKLNVDIKSKTMEDNGKLMDLPCGNVNEFELKPELFARNCNDNFVNLLKNSPNLMTSYENVDSIQNINDLKSYQSNRDFDDIFNAAPMNDIKDAKLLGPTFTDLPVANYKDFYADLVVDTSKEEMTKRNGNNIGSGLGAPPARGCDCKVRNDLVDLGQQHFPRYLLNAVCQSEQSRHDLAPKCWSGSICRPLEYKVKVLTFRTLVDNMQKDPTMAWLPDDLRQIWKFKTVTVTAGCFCS